MELMFITLIGVAIGLVARGVIRPFVSTGVALIPAFGGASSAIVWVALTWLRLRWDQPLIWLITITVAVLTSIAAGVVATRVRRRQDDRLFEEIQAAAR